MKANNYFQSPIFNASFHAPAAVILIQVLALLIFAGYWSEKIVDCLYYNQRKDRVIEFVKRYILIYHYFLIYLLSALTFAGLLSLHFAEYLVKNYNYPEAPMEWYYKYRSDKEGIDFSWSML